MQFKERSTMEKSHTANDRETEEGEVAKRDGRGREGRNGNCSLIRKFRIYVYLFIASIF